MSTNKTGIYHITLTVGERSRLDSKPRSFNFTRAINKAIREMAPITDCVEPLSRASFRIDPDNYEKLKGMGLKDRMAFLKDCFNEALLEEV